MTNSDHSKLVSDSISNGFRESVYGYKTKDLKKL